MLLSAICKSSHYNGSWGDPRAQSKGKHAYLDEFRVCVLHVRYLTYLCIRFYGIQGSVGDPLDSLAINGEIHGHGRIAVEEDDRVQECEAVVANHYRETGVWVQDAL